MDDKTVIVFAFPRKVLLEADLATRMGLIQDILKDIPEVQILSVVGGTADKVVSFLDTKDDEPSGLVLHAMRELELAGNDEDFNKSIIAAVEGFRSYGHSGGSAEVGISILHDLLQHKNLTPLTDDPKEWNDVGEMGDILTWQSVRNPEAFSRDGGKTYYLLSEGANATNPEPLHESTRFFVPKEGG